MIARREPKSGRGIENVKLLRFLGLDDTQAGRETEPASLVELARTLEGLPVEQGRFVAAFSYLMARVAGTDLEMAEKERTAIAARLETFAELDGDTASRLADAALASVALHGASDDHLVARAFRDMSEHEERLRLIRCLLAVAAADETITTREDNEIFEVAAEIGVDRRDVVAIRSQWKDYLGSMRALPRER
jgi:uncharacterized tellurite resistance protein B-like protein